MTLPEEQSVTKEMASEIIGDIGQVAKHFGKSKRTIFRWKRVGMPMLSDGRFNIEEIEVWLKKKRGISDGSQPDAPMSGKIFWDTENKRFQAKARELEYLKRKGHLVERKEVEELFHFPSDQVFVTH